MSIISKKLYKNIEWHFYHYNELKKEVAETEADILNAADYSIEATGVHGTDTSDKVGNTVLRLEGALEDKAGWCKVIEATVEKFRSNVLGMMLNMVYVEKLGQQAICEALHIERSTYFSWKLDIITYAAMLACKKNLIDM